MPWKPDIGSNIILVVTTKLFLDEFRLVWYLNEGTLNKAVILSIMMGLIKSPEGLKRKRITFSSKERILPGDSLWTQTAALPWVSSLPH